MLNGAELIPELHDIGKLTKNKKHNFEDLGIKLETPTWRGILEHHCTLDKRCPDPKCRKRYYYGTYKGKIPARCDVCGSLLEEELREYPKSYETLLLCLADNLASSVSRAKRPPSKEVMYNVYKLWRPPKREIDEVVYNF